MSIPASSSDVVVLGLARVKLLVWKPLMDDMGDKLPYGVSESEEPRLSEPTPDNTDFGDWFS